MKTVNRELLRNGASMLLLISVACRESGHEPALDATAREAHALDISGAVESVRPEWSAPAGDMAGPHALSVVVPAAVSESMNGGIPESRLPVGTAVVQLEISCELVTDVQRGRFALHVPRGVTVIDPLPDGAFEFSRGQTVSYATSIRLPAVENARYALLAQFVEEMPGATITSNAEVRVVVGNPPVTPSFVVQDDVVLVPSAERQ